MNWLSNMLREMGHAHAAAPWRELVADASSRSGYVRERAVIAIAKTGSADGLAILLWRANDWVAEVRRAATAGIGLYLVSAHIDAWARALPAVAALERGGRVDHGPLLERIRSFLTTVPHMGVLRAFHGAPTREVARLLFTLEMALPDAAGGRLHRLLRAVQGDDIVQASLAMQAASTLVEADRVCLGAQACASRFASVRAQGLRLFGACGQRPATAQMLLLCRDASPLVRALAWPWIGGDRAELEALLRAEFGGTGGAQCRAIALDGLCALAVPDAAAACQRGSADAAVTVRCVAFTRRFQAADDPQRDALVVQVLQDRSVRVRRLALERIRRGAQPPEVPMLLALESAQPTALASLAKAAERLSPWARLDFLLLVALRRLHEPAVFAQALAAVEAWHRDMATCFVTPTAGQAASLSRTWAGLRDSLPAALQQRLLPELRLHKVLA